MPRGKKFTAEQIIGKLREGEAELARGKAVPEQATTPLLASAAVLAVAAARRRRRAA